MFSELAEELFASDACQRLLETQDGLLHRDQLLALGFSRQDVADLIRERQIKKLFPRVYAIRSSLEPRLQLARAVTLRFPRAVLSHRTALLVYGLDGIASASVELSLCNVSRKRSPTIKLYRKRKLPQSDVRLIDGLPVTTIARTLFDLAHVCSDMELACAVDHAWRLGLVTLRELIDRYLASRKMGRNSLKRMRRVLKDCKRRKRPFDSALEVRWWYESRRAKLPTQLIQARFEHDGVKGRMDFLFPKHALVVETCGARFHAPDDAFERDSRRTLRLAALGYTVIPITWRMLEEDTKGVVQRVREALTERERLLESGEVPVLSTEEDAQTSARTVVPVQATAEITASA